jgi:hypothetical protein
LGAIVLDQHRDVHLGLKFHRKLLILEAGNNLEC